MRMRQRIALVLALLFLVAGGALFVFGRGLWLPLLMRITGERTVADVLAKIGPAARAQLRPSFAHAGVAYPPRELALLVFKRERRVAVWARDAGAWRFIRAYPVFAASGHAGPKLREGDYQVPEGLYRFAWLNPNSS